MWLKYDLNKNKQVLINYDNQQPTKNRLTSFGFIDEWHHYETLNILIDYNLNDINLKIKNKYFITVWNKKWLLNNPIIINTKRFNIYFQKLIYILYIYEYVMNIVYLMI